MIYEWRAGSRFHNLNPQVVGEELENLRQKKAGFITAHDVLEAAMPEDAVLHEAFEWDNEAAADQYRKAQAGQLVASVTVRFDEKPETLPVRAFVLIKGEGQRAFTSIVSAMDNAAMREQVIQRAYKELQAWQQRYRQYEELSDVLRAIGAINGVSPKTITSTTEPTMGR